MIGFGGGSSYTALMVLFDVSYLDIPKVSLLCNLVVVSGSSFYFYKNKLFNFKITKPLLLGSIPCSFIGGTIHLNEKTFFIFLGGSLFLSGIRLIFQNDPFLKNKRPSSFILFLLGSFLGFIAGLVGIGGGIFLSPILMNLKIVKPKMAAATACLFILLNSLAGVLGQFTKVTSFGFQNNQLWWLLLVVFFGGQMGIKFGINPSFGEEKIRKLTGVLTLFVALRILLSS